MLCDLLLGASWAQPLPRLKPLPINKPPLVYILKVMLSRKEWREREEVIGDKKDGHGTEGGNDRQRGEGEDKGQEARSVGKAKEQRTGGKGRESNCNPPPPMWK